MAAREFALVTGHTVLVDEADFGWATQWKWRPHGPSLKRGKVYAWRNYRTHGGRTERAFLHRVLAGAAPGQMVDHVNGNSLDCRRENLRIVTARQNAQNTRSSKNAKAGGFKGVYFVKRSRRWAASIGAGEVGGNGRARRIHLGCFATPEEAALAYDRAAREHFGEFAATNFPEEGGCL